MALASLPNMINRFSLLPVAGEASLKTFSEFHIQAVNLGSHGTFSSNVLPFWIDE